MPISSVPEFYSKPLVETDNSVSLNDISTSVKQINGLTFENLVGIWGIHSSRQLDVLCKNIARAVTVFNSKASAHNQKINASLGWKILHIFVRCITLFISSGLKHNLLQSEGTINHLKKFQDAIRKEEAARKIQSLYRNRLQNRISQNSGYQNELKVRSKDNSIKRVKSHWKKLGEAAGLSDAQVFEEAKQMKDIYRKYGYYVFTHGASSGTSVIFDLNKVLVEHCHPEHMREHYYKAFRIPGTMPYFANVSAYAQNRSIDYVGFQDNAVSIELLSVDANFYSERPGESARSYYSMNRGASKKYANILNVALQNYVKDPALLKGYTERLMQIADERHSESSRGCFYVIAIPEDIVKDEKKNFVYRSYALGLRCNAYPRERDIEILEKIQNDQTADLQNTQYRMITCRLAEEKRVEAIAVSPIARKKIKEYRRLIKVVGWELAVCKLLDEIGNVPSPKLLMKLTGLALLLHRYYKNPTTLKFANQWQPLIMSKAVGTLMQHSDMLGSDNYSNLHDLFEKYCV